MSLAKATIKERVDSLLNGVSTTDMSAADRYDHVDAAVRRYSKDKPRLMVDNITGDGGRFYALSGLTSWQDEFSQVVGIEWDAASTVTNDDLPVVLEPEDWTTYDDGTTKYLMLTYGTASSGDTVRVTYTVPWAFDDSDDIAIPDVDFDGLCYLAAAMCCRALAVRYGQHEDSSFAVDSVNYGSLTDKYIRLAKQYEEMYGAEIGMSAAVKAAGAFVDWDRTTVEGRDFIWHTRRRR